MPDRDYPETVTEVLDDGARFKPAALRALREFRRSRPWRGTPDERAEKFRQLNRDLAAAYGISEPELAFECLDGGNSGSSHYSRIKHRITLKHRLSVVTFIHEFAHALGRGERGATAFSVNLFRRVFPSQYARAVHVGHMLIRPADLIARGS